MNREQAYAMCKKRNNYNPINKYQVVINWQAFINTLTDQELCYLIYREDKHSYSEIGHFMDVSTTRVGYISKQVRKKASNFIEMGKLKRKIKGEK